VDRLVHGSQAQNNLSYLISWVAASAGAAGFGTGTLVGKRTLVTSRHLSGLLGKTDISIFIMLVCSAVFKIEVLCDIGAYVAKIFLRSVRTWCPNIYGYRSANLVQGSPHNTHATVQNLHLYEPAFYPHDCCETHCF
jgi:hypothetical protein